VDAEALAVVHRRGEAADLQLAAVAGAGVHLADGQRPAEQRARPRVHPARQREHRVVAGAERLGDEAGPEDLGEEPHQRGRGSRASSRSRPRVVMSWLLKIRRATRSSARISGSPTA